MHGSTTHRAIGIVRVSRPGDREDGDERFRSPDEQRDSIRALCAREGWKLLDIYPEMKVSGGALLANRPGLSRAVTALLTGSADRIVGAYSDRLWRSTEVRSQVLRLVEDVGGEVWSGDEGRVSNGTAAAKFNGTVRTAADELYKDQIAEKSRAAQQRAINDGIVPWPNIPPGYLRAADGRLQPDPETASVVADAFRMRAAGATIAAVRSFLAARGVKRSQHGVTAMLGSRIYLGEVHFGRYEPNLSAHPAIVDVATWKRVQRAKVSRGRRAKSERLLARLGVLRCGSCGARMVVGTSNNSGYYLYRCPPNGDCTRRVTIGAEIAEQVVADAVRAALADAEGRASVEDNAHEAELELERAQQELDAAIRAFTGLEGETAARERLAELRDLRDQAQDRVDHLGGGLRPAITINAAADWDRLSLDARRALIRATVAQAVVGAGRGADRITVELVGE